MDQASRFERQENSETAIWLITEADPYLQLAYELLDQGKSEIAVQKMLREKIGDLTYSRAVMRQVNLRKKARVKFRRADRMFFDELALQQSSSEILADYKAKRFPNLAPIEDWCCGIGGDLIGLARQSQNCKGFELSPVLARFAQTNLERNQLQAKVICNDVSQQKPNANTWIHIDPARRVGKAKTVQIDKFSPSLETLEQVVEHSAGACIKLAPATKIPLAWSPRVEMQWLQHQGECKQLLVWSGELARNPGQNSVAVIEAGKSYDLIEPKRDSLIDVRRCREALPFIYEPVSAIKVAGMVEHLADLVRGQVLDSNPTYVVSDNHVTTPFASLFRLERQSSTNLSRLAKDIQELNPAQIEFKCRPPLLKLNDVQKRIKLSGSQPLTVIAARVGGKSRVWLTRRLKTDPGPSSD